jgi:putative ABC transport system substrate-binding protein
MRRREFIAGLGGAAASSAAWPLAARAQRPAMPVIGDLSSTSPGQFERLTAAFRQGLNEAGYIEGQNVAIEYRWAEGQYDRLPALAADLVRRQVAVILAEGNTPALAAKAATSTIPIVFIGNDPVRTGLVARINRPGGNLTGVELFVGPLGAKRLGLLHELIPNAAVIALLVNPDNANTATMRNDVEEAGRTIGRQIVVVNARSGRDLDTAFATLVGQRAGGLLVGGDPFFDSVLRDQLVTLAARHSLPTIYPQREYAADGGLMSYGTSLADAYRLAGTYTGRILKGEKPADLPVQQATRFEFVVNLKTAKTLGLAFPAALLVRADEVIE